MDLIRFDIAKKTSISGLYLDGLAESMKYPDYCHRLNRAYLGNGDFWLFAGYPTTQINHNDILDLQTFKSEITSLHGPFFAAYWEKNTNNIVLISDILGLFPIYWSIKNDQIQICNKIIPLAKKPNLASWGSFYAYGCCIGNNTLAEGVERLPPASLITVDIDNLDVKIESYWTWPDRTRKASVNEVFDALISDLETAKPLLSDPHIFLSGGFDSRLLASGLSHIGITPKAIIVSHADEKLDLDRKYATLLAAKLGFPMTSYFPNSYFFKSEKYIEYLKATDGETPSLNLFIPKVSEFTPPGEFFEGLLPGYTLPLVHQLDQPSGGPREYINDIKIVAQRNSSRWKSLERLFTKETVNQMWEGFLSQSNIELLRYEDSDHGTVQFISMNKMRNRTSINPLKVYSEKSIPISVCQSRSYLEAISQLEYSDRKNAHFYITLLKTKFPNSFTIPVISGGICYPLGSSKIKQATDSLQESFHHWTSLYPSFGKYLFKSIREQNSQNNLVDEYLDMFPFDPDEDINKGININSLLELSEPEKSDAIKCLFHWNAWKYLKNNSLDVTTY